MAYENDWLMQQIRGISNMAGTVFNLETHHLDLGTVEDEEGKKIKGIDYLNSLIFREKYTEANVFIKSQMKRINYHQYSTLVDEYINFLLTLDDEVLIRNKLDRDKIYEIQKNLKQFEW